MIRAIDDDHIIIPQTAQEMYQWSQHLNLHGDFIGAIQWAECAYHNGAEIPAYIGSLYENFGNRLITEQPEAAQAMYDEAKFFFDEAIDMWEESARQRDTTNMDRYENAAMASISHLGLMLIHGKGFDNSIQENIDEGFQMLRVSIPNLLAQDQDTCAVSYLLACQSADKKHNLDKAQLDKIYHLTRQRREINPNHQGIINNLHILTRNEFKDWCYTEPLAKQGKRCFVAMLEGRAPQIMGRR